MDRDPRRDLRDLDTLGFLGRAQPERARDMILRAAELLEQLEYWAEYLPRLAEAIRAERGS